MWSREFIEEVKEDELMLKLTDIILNKLRAKLGDFEKPTSCSPVTSGLGASIMMGEEYY